MGTIAVVVLFMLIGAFFYIRRSNLDFLYNKTAWAAIATVRLGILSKAPIAQGSYFSLTDYNIFVLKYVLMRLILQIFCFTMVSGQMWNHIRGPPFVHKSPSGGVAYIHGSSQGQFVLETYIIFILSILLSA